MQFISFYHHLRVHFSFHCILKTNKAILLHSINCESFFYIFHRNIFNLLGLNRFTAIKICKIFDYIDKTAKNVFKKKKSKSVKSTQENSKRKSIECCTIQTLSTRLRCVLNVGMQNFPIFLSFRKILTVTHTQNGLYRFLFQLN